MRDGRHNLKRTVCIIAQHHVAVEVETLGNAGPFKANEGSKVAGIVMLFGGLYDVFPSERKGVGTGAVGFQKQLRQCALGKIGNQIEGCFARLFAALFYPSYHSKPLGSASTPGFPACKSGAKPIRSV